jgi:uncharacterized membrane protein|tara:strand:- start:10956 stop:11303 length:348 start_codon:yes stop_codon:yes gene_type:complete
MGEDYDKIISILAYIPFIGWIIALILNSDKAADEKSYNAFHLRQGLGLFIVYLIYSLLSWLITWIPYLGIFADRVIVFIFIIIAIMGILNASKGMKKPLPLFGEKVDAVLAGAFE